MNKIMQLEATYAASCHQPLPVMLVKGEGVYVYDQNGKPYLDMATGVAVLNFGHCHPQLIQALVTQANTLTTTSRLFYHDKLGQFLQMACQLFGQEKAICMNSGAEAVETAIKIARKWGYIHKNINDNKAEIIVCDNNFHGRTITTISFSSTPTYKDKFGPLTPGFKSIPYNNPQALQDAITPQTVAFLVEPMQGEAGVIIPDQSYLAACQRICQSRQVLLICDEIQTGLGRTGKMLACQHAGVTPDLVLLGKALGGGLLPVSMVLGKAAIMDVLALGEHGSTFGGNPLAAAVGLAVLNLLVDEQLSQQAAKQGAYLCNQLRLLNNPLIKEVRGEGLFIGITLDAKQVSSRKVCQSLATHGLLTVDTRGNTLRLLPPLNIQSAQIMEAIDIIEKVMGKLTKMLPSLS